MRRQNPAFKKIRMHSDILPEKFFYGRRSIGKLHRFVNEREGLSSVSRRRDGSIEKILLTPLQGLSGSFMIATHAACRLFCLPRLAGVVGAFHDCNGVIK
jgi:hypothetical protein